MSGLRLDVDLDKIGDNARPVVERAAERGVSITAVTKAGLGDSHIENIERMRYADINSPMLLLRSPMPSQADRIVRSGTISVNTETDVLDVLAGAARVCGSVHDVMVMVELGDLRDGVMPAELHDLVRHILRVPTLRIQGIGTTLACRNGIEPSDENMGELSRLVDTVESTFSIEIPTVSGGNSANLDWLANTGKLGRVNNLRLGEAILLGRNPPDRDPIAGLHTDAAMGSRRVERLRCNLWNSHTSEDRGQIWQTIVAAGRQDIDPDDLGSTVGMTVLAASSDHLILETSARPAPGDEIRFEPGYSTLLRSMTSPFVSRELSDRRSSRTRSAGFGAIRRVDQYVVMRIAPQWRTVCSFSGGWYRRRADHTGGGLRGGR